MTISAGSLLVGGNAQNSFFTTGNSGGFSTRSEENTPNNRNAATSLNISQDGLEALKTIEQGIEAQRGSDINFARQRVEETRKLITLLKSLLQNATPNQAREIRKQLDAVGKNIQNIGNQVKQIVRGQGVASSLSVQNSEFTAQFNSAAAQLTGEAFDPSVFSYREELNVEFTFLRFTETTETLEINQLENGGLEVVRTVEQTELTIKQLNIEFEQELYLQNQNTEVQNLVRDLLGLAGSFSDLSRDTDNKAELTQNAENESLTFIEELLEELQAVIEGAGPRESVLVNQSA